MADASHVNLALEFLRQAVDLGERLAETMPERDIMVFDPIPMALMRVADKERAQLLIEAPNKAALNVFLRQWYRALLEVKTNVHWVMEVDPMDV
jgi:primosomal protein N' (replication factor Y)